jgi:two-component sensor histidine kinase
MTVELVRDYLADESAAGNDALPAEMLVAESNHRIANNLTLIAGLVRLQASGLAKAGGVMTAVEACQLLEEVSVRIDAVGRLHRLLATRQGQPKLDLGQYLQEVASAAAASMSAQGETSLVFRSTAACEISTRQALPIGFIVGELVTNAVKYAHPTGVAGRIEIGCHRSSRGATLIQIADDGVGLPEGFDPQSDGGLGMRVVRSLAAQIGASLTFKADDIGLTVRLQVSPRLHAEAE